MRHLEYDEHEAVNFLAKAQHLKMNFWTPTFHSWGTDLNMHGGNMPWYTLFDYVEAYRYNNDSHGWDLAWRDDFNEFDESRWRKETGTFEANSAIFAPNNVYVENGNLVIKMERDDHTTLAHDEHEPLHH